jgi:hypothetical protein
MVILYPHNLERIAIHDCPIAACYRLVEGD